MTTFEEKKTNNDMKNKRSFAYEKLEIGFS